MLHGKSRRNVNARPRQRQRPDAEFKTFSGDLETGQVRRALHYAGGDAPALVQLLSLASSSCRRSRAAPGSAGLFSEQNARAHVAMLAGTIGSRPVGTEANARARAYVIDQLRLFGYDVRVQETDARRPELGRTARVSNIIARAAGDAAGSDRAALALRLGAEAPGAADDGLGVAVSLEAARVLAARADRQWTTLRARHRRRGDRG